MDERRFDELIRNLSVGAVPRRAALHALLGGILGLGAAGAVDARKQQKAKQKGNGKKRPTRAAAKPAAPGNAGCAAFCKAVFPPGAERGACISAATRGEPRNLCAACGADPARFCAGRCRDLTADPQHCGRCGQTCGDGSDCGGTCRDGVCGYPGPETACGPAATCVDGAATARGNCDGAGGCTAGTVTACAPYRCGADACRETCRDDDDCVGSAYCDANNRCVGDGANGAPCRHGGECQSGHCAGGVCCGTPCDGACEACDANGACSPVTGGACGNRGTCRDGHCEEPKGNGERCGQDGDCASGHCVDGVCCDTGCSGACRGCALPGMVGVCSPRTGGACGDGGTCQNGDCAEPNANGQPCHQGNACRSGHCVDGVCCEGACGGECRRCDLPGSEGTCSPVSGGSCGNGGTCQSGQCIEGTPNGQACQQASDCASHHCVGGVCCNTACDGVCESCNQAGSIGTCGPSPTGMRCGYGTCRDGQCTYRAIGEHCQFNEECANRRCVHGYCCDSYCEGGGCLRCNLPGMEGTCSVVTGSTCGPGYMGATCQSDGVCEYPSRCGTCGDTVYCGIDSVIITDCRRLHKADGGCACVFLVGYRTGCNTDADCPAPSPYHTGVCLDEAAITADGACPGSPTGQGNVCAALCRKNAQSPCQHDSECLSGHCADGVCCATACGQCEACNRPAHVGTCWPVTTGSCGIAAVAVTCPYGGRDEQITLSCPVGFTPDLDATHCVCGKVCSSDADCHRFGEICRNGHCCMRGGQGYGIYDYQAAMREISPGRYDWDENPGGLYCCSGGTWNHGFDSILSCD